MIIWFGLGCLVAGMLIGWFARVYWVANDVEVRGGFSPYTGTFEDTEYEYEEDDATDYWDEDEGIYVFTSTPEERERLRRELIGDGDEDEAELGEAV